MFDSNEVLEAKLMTGKTGYDVVVPSLTFLARQIEAGVFMPLDKSKLPNFANWIRRSRPDRQNDPGNTHSVNYLWGTTGIGYNVNKIKELLGDDAPVDSWELIFDPEISAKMTDCGVYILDTPSEIMPIVLNYLGEEPNSFDPAVIQKRRRPDAEDPSVHHPVPFLADTSTHLPTAMPAWRSAGRATCCRRPARAEEAGKGVEVAYMHSQRRRADVVRHDGDSERCQASEQCACLHQLHDASEVMAGNFQLRGLCQWQ